MFLRVFEGVMEKGCGGVTAHGLGGDFEFRLFALRILLRVIGRTGRGSRAAFDLVEKSQKDTTRF